MRGRVVAVSGLVAVMLGSVGPRAGTAQVTSVAPSPVRVEVTGDPAPVETLRLAILTTARTLVPEAGAGEVSLADTAPPLQPLPAAGEVTLRAVLQVATDAGPVTRAVPVEIKNEAIPWSDAEALLISNSPETLPFGKVLLSGSVSTGQTVRLLYHHANGSQTQRMSIAVDLSNPDRAPISLWLTGAAGGAGGDELGLGHVAARVFLDQYWHRAGFLVRIPANTTLPVFTHDLAPGAIASGLAQLTLLEGPSVNVQVYARLAGEMAPPPMSYQPNFDKLHQRGTFPRPQVVHRFTYTVGDPTLVMMAVGDEPEALRESQTGAALNGNYGVVYSFPIDVYNPAPLPSMLGLVVQAVSGQAGASVLVDDRIFDIPRLRGGERRLVTTVRLAAGERRRVTVATMPESGGYYPIRLIFGTQYQ